MVGHRGGPPRGNDRRVLVVLGHPESGYTLACGHFSLTYRPVAMPDIDIPSPQGRKDETQVGIIIAVIESALLASRAYRLQPSTGSSQPQSAPSTR